MSDFGVPHLSGRKPDREAGCLERGPWRFPKETIESRLVRLSDGVVFALFAAAESVQDDEDEEGALRHERAKYQRRGIEVRGSRFELRMKKRRRVLNSSFGIRTSNFNFPRSRSRDGLLALEHHADVIGRAGLDVDRGDAHQLPTFFD